MNIAILLRSLKNGIYKMWFLDAFFGAAVVYLISYTIAFLLRFPAMQVSLSIAIFYFISEIVKNVKDEPLLLIERKYDAIDEELRTVNDTLGEKNEIVISLREEVIRKVQRNVDFGDFIDFQKMVQRTLTVFFLSFFIVFFASLNIYIPFLDIENLLSKTDDFINDVYESVLEDSGKLAVGNSNLLGELSKLANSAGTAAGDLEGEEIFGEAEVVELGSEKLYVDIRPTDFEVSVDDFEDVQQKQFQDALFQQETSVEKAALFDEDIPQQNQDIVKKYFQKIAE